MFKHLKFVSPGLLISALIFSGCGKNPNVFLEENRSLIESTILRDVNIMNRDIAKLEDATVRNRNTPDMKLKSVHVESITGYPQSESLKQAGIQEFRVILKAQDQKESYSAACFVYYYENESKITVEVCGNPTDATYGAPVRAFEDIPVKKDLLIGAQ